jgi:uncharacterized surface protein with fasciclin (FAS1) repeats
MPDIVELAIAGNFKTLVAAVQAAGLVDTLKGPGPFTVFAPTDDAFAKLPKGTVDGLLKDVPKLKSILLYHVVPGKVMAADVVKLKTAKTVQGQELRIQGPKWWQMKKVVKINNATVIKPDIVASNGVCHAIDTVLIPP